MPSPAEVSDAIMDGLNEHYGHLDSEVFVEADGTLLVALNYEDGDRYMVRIEPGEALWRQCATPAASSGRATRRWLAPLAKSSVWYVTQPSVWDVAVPPVTPGRS